MALIPEDRKTEGLMLPMSVRDNMSFAASIGSADRGIVDRGRERQAVDEMIRALRSGPATSSAPVATPSRAAISRRW